eukprot:m.77113 g.77113  ORF g.77113 m.77113 type:complete len:453 (+) comp12602_c0_seq4:167-1525(+)
MPEFGLFSRTALLLYFAGMLLWVTLRLNHVEQTMRQWKEDVNNLNLNNHLKQDQLAQLDQESLEALRKLIINSLEKNYGIEEQAQLLIELSKEVVRLKRQQLLRSDDDEKDDENRKQAAQAKDKPICVNNPALHYEFKGDVVSECSPKIPSTPDTSNGWPKRAYILTLDAFSPGIKQRQAFLGRNNVRLNVFHAVDGRELYGRQYSHVYDEVEGQNVSYHRDPQTGLLTVKGQPGFLTAGERGYRDSMSKLFRNLIQRNYTGNVLVVDDDVLFRCDFADKLKEVLQSPRCGNHIQKHAVQGGVLLLGAAVWINGTYPDRGDFCAGWNLIEADLNWAKEATKATPRCFNANRKTFGSFAVIYHSAVFPVILKWLENTKTTLYPYDHVYPMLFRAGYIVRVAHPNVAIQDVRHPSQVDTERRHQDDMEKRAELHHWGDLSLFCDPADSLPLRQH